MTVDVHPSDLRIGDVLPDGFVLTHNPAPADFMNRVRVWGLDHNGDKVTRQLRLIATYTISRED